MAMIEKNEVGIDNTLLLKAKSDALRLLSFRPRSVKEMQDRLRLKKYPEAMIRDVVDFLKKQGFLNDEKFAKLYAESRVYSRPTGRRQLAFDMKQKGISAPLVEETLSNITDYDEKKMAKDLAVKRFDRMSGLSAEKKKARLFGFLKRRGFGADTIFSVLSELSL